MHNKPVPGMHILQNRNHERFSCKAAFMLCPFCGSDGPYLAGFPDDEASGGRLSAELPRWSGHSIPASEGCSGQFRAQRHGRKPAGKRCRNDSAGKERGMARNLLCALGSGPAEKGFRPCSAVKHSVSAAVHQRSHAARGHNQALPFLHLPSKGSSEHGIAADNLFSTAR